MGALIATAGRRLVSFDVTPELFAHVLGMPKDCDIVWSEWGALRGNIRLFVESAQFPEVTDRVKSVTPIVHSRAGTWDWNLGEAR